MLKKKTEQKQLIDSFIEMNSNDNYKEIFDTLLDSDNNLELKTHIVNPIATTLIQFYSESLNIFGYSEPSKLVDSLLHTFLSHMVSYKRLSRTEILNAIAFKPELDITESSVIEKIKKNATKL